MAVENVHKRTGGQFQQRKEEFVFPKRTLLTEDVIGYGVYSLTHIAVLVSPFYFTWRALWVAIILGLVTLSIGISLSYHRNLTHRSLKLTKSLEYLFAYIGLHAVQGDPMFWVSVHRYHHQFTDTHRDPHTPIKGFWFSHLNWIFHRSYIKEQCEQSNVMDLQKQVFYGFLQRTEPFHIGGLALLLYIIGGLPYLIWGMGVRVAVVHHITLAVNSVCHRWGKRPWDTNDLSTNNLVMGLLTLGEGWHNNHHAFQFSARIGLEWWEIDVPWYIVKLLEYLGLATDVKVPTEFQKLKLSTKYNYELDSDQAENSDRGSWH